MILALAVVLQIVSSSPTLPPAEAAAVLARLDWIINRTQIFVWTDCDGPRIAVAPYRCGRHWLQMDVKFLERIPGTRKRLNQFTAIDDCTRIPVLKAYDACHQGTAIRFVDEVLRRLPFRVLVIETDNGAEFQSRLKKLRDSRAAQRSS